MDKFETFGTLKEDTEAKLLEIFPDRKVPLLSVHHVHPGNIDNPECFLVDAKQLSEDQTKNLAEMLFAKWQEAEPLTRIQNIETAFECVKNGLPLQASHFQNRTTTDFSQLIDFDGFENSEI